MPAARSYGCFYAGLEVGSIKVDNLDGNKTSAGGFLGYSFNQYVALELGYRQLGKWDINGGTIKLGQTQLSVVGTYPLSPEFDIFGRLGHDAVRVDSSVQAAPHADSRLDTSTYRGSARVELLVFQPTPVPLALSPCRPAVAPASFFCKYSGTFLQSSSNKRKGRTDPT
jgi:hypothetical protein